MFNQQIYYLIENYKIFFLKNSKFFDASYNYVFRNNSTSPQESNIGWRSSLFWLLENNFPLQQFRNKIENMPYPIFFSATTVVINFLLAFLLLHMVDWVVNEKFWSSKLDRRHTVLAAFHFGSLIVRFSRGFSSPLVRTSGQTPLDDSFVASQ